MTSARRVARIIGMLLLVQLPTGLIVPYVMLLPLKADFLEAAAPMSTCGAASKPAVTTT